MKKITLLISLTLCINISCSQNVRKKEMFSWWNNSKAPTPPLSSRQSREQNYGSRNNLNDDNNQEYYGNNSYNNQNSYNRSRWNSSKKQNRPPSSKSTREQNSTYRNNLNDDNNNNNIGEWECPRCTYLNSNMLSYCEMCNSIKPNKKKNQSHKHKKKSNKNQRPYNYQNDEKQEKDDKKDKKTKKITKLLIEAANAIEKYDNIYNAVLFLGITDSGKSTTINYLLGNKLEKIEKIYERKQDNDRSERKYYDDDDENDDEKIKQYYYRLGKNEIGPKIGDTTLSETLYPEPFFSRKIDFCYCDCPGFEDNRGDAELIANAAGTNSFLKKVKNVAGIAFVCDYRSLEVARANNFLKGIIKGINGMFYNSNDLSVFDSMAFLITKAPNFLKAKDVCGKLEKFKNDFIQSNNSTFTTSIKYLNAITERENNIVIIHLDDKNKAITKQSKTYIEKSIKKFRGISKDKFKFIGGESAKFKINNMAENVLSKLFEPLNYIFYGGPQEIIRLKNENNKILNKIKEKQNQLNKEKQNNKKKLNDIYSEITNEENDIDDELIDKRNATRSDFQSRKSHKQAEMMMKQEIEINQCLREENIKKQQELDKIDEENKLIEEHNKKIQEEMEDIKEKKRDCEKNLHLNEEKKKNLEKENINVLNCKDDIENVDLKIKEQEECFDNLLDEHVKLAEKFCKEKVKCAVNQHISIDIEYYVKKYDMDSWSKEFDLSFMQNIQNSLKWDSERLKKLIEIAKKVLKKYNTEIKDVKLRDVAWWHFTKDNTGNGHGGTYLNNVFPQKFIYHNNSPDYKIKEMGDYKKYFDPNLLYCSIDVGARWYYPTQLEELKSWYEKNLKKEVDKSIKELIAKKHLIESLKKKKEQTIRRKNEKGNIIKNNKQTLEATINNNKNDLNNKYKNKISSLKSQKKSYKAKKASTIDLTQIKSEIQSKNKMYIANENSKLEQEERNKLDSIQNKINKKKKNLKNKKSKKQNELAEELKNREEIVKAEIKQQQQENANINKKLNQIFIKSESCKQEIKQEQETAKMVLTINKYLKLKDDVPKIEEFELLFNKWSNI